VDDFMIFLLSPILSACIMVYCQNLSGKFSV
jgi:hypothetical protein